MLRSDDVMARINRRPSANRRSTLVDPKKGASGSIAEAYRSSILGAPAEFRDSTTGPNKFDPDTASLYDLSRRSGEIATAMEPAPEELTFSDTGKIRDIFRQEEDRYEEGKVIPGEFMLDRSKSPSGDRLKSAMETESRMFNAWLGSPRAYEFIETPIGGGKPDLYGAFLKDTGFDIESHLFDKVPKMSEPKFIKGGVEVGKALTTGRLLREHPDKFKTEGEAGGRFFGRIPAIKRRTDTKTALGTMPKTSPYGTPGGMKFIDESAYLGKPDSSLIGL